MTKIVIRYDNNDYNNYSTTYHVTHKVARAIETFIKSNEIIRGMSGNTYIDEFISSAVHKEVESEDKE